MSKPQPRRRVSSQPNLRRTAYDQSMLYRNQPHTSRSLPPIKSKDNVRPHNYRALLIVLLLIAFGGHVLWSKHASAEALAAQQAKVAAQAEAKRQAANFSGQIAALIDENPTDTLSIATYSPTDGLQTYGSDAAFDGASTGKLLTAVDYLHHVERGTATLQKNIDGQTARYWLRAMLVDSDDTAWSELNTYLTHEDLANYASSIGFTSYDPDTNTFTARDVAILLQQLYQGKLLNSSNRSLVLNYMSQANYRQYIVAAVPAGDNVYHKVGIDADTVNDAAIVTHGQRYLILVVFSDGNGSYNWGARAQLIQSITKDATAAYL